ncbi:hypothetical protein [Thermoflexus hugenholtzii]
MSDGFCVGGVCAPASVWAGVILWLLYGLLFLFIRVFLVAGMLRELTRAEIEGTRCRIELEQERSEEILPSEKNVLNNVTKLLDEANNKVSWTFVDKVKALFWNGGAELAAWRLIHEAERLAVNAMATPHLKARLQRALGDLSELPPARRTAWEKRLQEAMGHANEEARAILSAFLADLYEARDERFMLVLKLQNLLTFMVLVGLLIGLALAVAGYGPILLAGAVGGLLSRMARLYKERETPDYGLSWATVFPASLFGALSAWAGLHLVAILQSQRILSLEALGTLSQLLIPPIALQKDTVPLLALGALFGLSERLLDRMVEKTEELWKKQEKKPEEGPPGETPEEIVRRMQLRLETEEQEKDGVRATRRMTLDVLQGPEKDRPSEAPRDREKPDSPTDAPPSLPPSAPSEVLYPRIPTR